MLHFWCQGAALLLALLSESLYSGFSGGLRTSFLNRRSRQFFILHSSFFILIAALRSVSLRLQSLNQKRSRNITDFFRSLFTDSFFDFFFLIFF